jgi:hypothetical protein
MRPIFYLLLGGLGGAALAENKELVVPFFHPSFEFCLLAELAQTRTCWQEGLAAAGGGRRAAGGMRMRARVPAIHCSRPHGRLETTSTTLARS